MMGQYLADLGAEVIKVEWYDRFDLYRTRGVERLRGAVPEEVRREMSFSFHSLNRGKLSFTANLKDPQALETLKDLVRHSDLLIENFTLGTLDRLGLGPDVLYEINERLVVVSLSASGRGSGVERLRAYGLVLSALGGAESEFVDEQGEFQGSPSFVVSDPNAALFGTFAAVVGLLHAQRNGIGATIECSQIEAMATLMRASRERSSPPGPHRMVETSDGYVAVSFPADVDARRFEEILDGVHSASSQELIDRVLAQGGHAAPVRSLADNEHTPEYAGAEVRIPTLHPVTGAEMVVAAPWRMEGRRPVVRKAAPTLGESNDYVLRRVLKLEDTRIQALRKGGAV